MKNNIFSYPLLALLLLIGCKDSVKSTDDVISDKGIVLEKSPGLYLIESETIIRNGSRLFWPSNLSDEFKKDSIRVYFTGTLETDPPSPVPYAPLHLSEIRVIN
jgi:hypothetical protein